MNSCVDLEFPEERPIKVTNLKTQEHTIFWGETRAQARNRAALYWNVTKEEVR